MDSYNWGMYCKPVIFVKAALPTVFNLIKTVSAELHFFLLSKLLLLFGLYCGSS